MKKIFGVFFRDLGLLSRNFVAVVVALGITVLPSLYAWFNIYACWDPYGNTAGIQVAVANTDQGFDLDGTQINVGDMVISKLRENSQLGWQFVDRDTAIHGTETGEYYSAVVIPENFSECIASILSSEIRRPDILYYVNEKKNAIAPKITDKGVGVIQQQVNETFISTCTEVVLKALNISDEKLSDVGGRYIDDITGSLAETVETLDSYGDTIAAVEAAVKATDTTVKTMKGLLPDAKSLTDSGKTSIDDIYSILTSAQNTSAQLSVTLEDVVSAALDMSDSVSDTVARSLRTLKTDARDAADELRDAAGVCDKIISVNNHIKSNLQALNAKLPVKLKGVEKLCAALDDATKTQKRLAGVLNDAAQTVKDTGALPAETQAALTQAAQEARAKLDAVQEQYQMTVSPQINTTIDSTYTGLRKLTSLLDHVNETLPAMDKSMDSVSKSLGDSVTALQKTSKLLQNAKEKLNAMIEEVGSVEKSGQVQKLLDIIRSDPEIAASFMASPVSINTQKLYPIENYGSAMTPFYTILAIWVGGLILCAILKCQVREDDKYKDLKPYQIYFGRYLTFMLFGILQSLIVCLGDLYLLKIQCLEPELFVLAGVLASIVFTNLIFTLTISFGDVGKAIAVILLVIQVAGAGGTFPIEVTPQFFQTLNPLLPFTSGINAMRETVAGVYGSNYWKDLLSLSFYVPISLFIGLVLRRPLIQLNEFFEHQLGKTGLM